jgi:acetylornithine deacetylase/succinyl-diaminopimelate desuccinylase-like protein
VPPELGKAHALERIRAVIGEDGFEVTFDETVVGNRSPMETPLMDSIRAFVKREDPDADVTAVVLPGFSDSRWFREAFPDCVAYGFFPQRAMSLFEAAPLVHGANERVPVEDLGMAARFYSDLTQETLG